MHPILIVPSIVSVLGLLHGPATDPPGQIACFVESESRMFRSLVVIEAKTGKRKVIEDHVLFSFDAHDPQRIAWFPGRERLALCTYVRPTRPHPNVAIYPTVVDTAASKLDQVHAGRARTFGVASSGELWAFVSEGQLWVQNPDKDIAKPIVKLAEHGIGDVTGIAWHGDSVYFSAHYYKSRTGVFRASPNDAELKHVLKQHVTLLAVVPSSGELLIARQLGPDYYAPRSLELHSVATNERRTLAKDLVFNLECDLSPTGDKLVYVRRISKNLCLVDTKSGEIKKLGHGMRPTFSPDEKWVAYQHRDTIHAIHIETGRRKKLGPGMRPAWSR